MDKSCCCHAVLTDSGESCMYSPNACVCVCRVISVGVCEAVNGSSISLWILSQCPDTGRSAAGLWGQWRGPLLQDSHSFLSTNSALHCTSLRCPLAYFSVRLLRRLSELEGQLSKMITLCIKHAAVSNFSSPSSVFSFLCSASLFLSDPMGEEHHTWGTSRIFTLMVVVCIHWSSCSFFLLTTHTHTFHVHIVEVLLMVWKNVQGWRGTVIAGNAKCIISHMFKCCTPGVPLIDKWANLLCSVI